MGLKFFLTATLFTIMTFFLTVHHNSYLVILTFPPELEGIKSFHFLYIVFNSLLETGVHTSCVVFSY